MTAAVPTAESGVSRHPDSGATWDRQDATDDETGSSAAAQTFYPTDPGHRFPGPFTRTSPPGRAGWCTSTTTSWTTSSTSTRRCSSSRRPSRWTSGAGPPTAAGARGPTDDRGSLYGRNQDDPWSKHSRPIVKERRQKDRSLPVKWGLRALQAPRVRRDWTIKTSLLFIQNLAVFPSLLSNGQKKVVCA